jgi:HPt (histidine-containing phosphotransfer) domain-containing protein
MNAQNESTQNESGDRIRARIADLIEDDNPDDVAFVEQLVASFLDRAPDMLARLDAAITMGDVSETVESAHALRGTAANIGAVGVAELCAEAEHAAQPVSARVSIASYQFPINGGTEWGFEH